jgi:hypothetical protein
LWRSSRGKRRSTRRERRSFEEKLVALERRAREATAAEEKLVALEERRAREATAAEEKLVALEERRAREATAAEEKLVALEERRAREATAAEESIAALEGRVLALTADLETMRKKFTLLGSLNVKDDYARKVGGLSELMKAQVGSGDDVSEPAISTVATRTVTFWHYNGPHPPPGVALSRMGPGEGGYDSIVEMFCEAKLAIDTEGDCGSAFATTVAAGLMAFVEEVEKVHGLNETALSMIVVAAIRLILPRVRVGKQSRVSMMPSALVLELDAFMSWGLTDAFITDGSDTVVALCEFKCTNVIEDAFFVQLFCYLLAMKSRINPPVDGDPEAVSRAPMTAYGLLCMREFFVVCDVDPAWLLFSKSRPRPRCLRKSDMITYDKLPKVLAALSQREHAAVFCSRSKPPSTPNLNSLVALGPQAPATTRMWSRGRSGCTRGGWKRV